MKTLNIVKQLKKQHRDIVFQAKQLEAAIDALSGKRKPMGTAGPEKRTMSASTRRKISLAQKKRWREQRRNTA